MAKILDGRVLAEAIRKDVKAETRKLKKLGIDVGLAILRVGENPASTQYYMATLKACENMGVKPYRFELPEEASTGEVLNVVHAIN
ncbi:MAG: tetrahydrofolate dehydrogenase/cyclohydrolase catalytic domain-containing protein, partial [Nitrospirota bacterium]